MQISVMFLVTILPSTVYLALLSLTLGITFAPCAMHQVKKFKIISEKNSSATEKLTDTIKMCNFFGNAETRKSSLPSVVN